LFVHLHEFSEGVTILFLWLRFVVLNCIFNHFFA
jgi:hypothetical protein